MKNHVRIVVLDIYRDLFFREFSQVFFKCVEQSEALTIFAPAVHQ